jgi:hypothetical protein
LLAFLGHTRAHIYVDEWFMYLTNKLGSNIFFFTGIGGIHGWNKRQQSNLWSKQNSTHCWCNFG